MTPSRRAEIEALASRMDGIISWPDAAPAFRELLAEVERLAKRAKDQTVALTGLTCGGSEFFVRDGDAFYANIDACVKYVRDRQSDQHREIVKRVGLQKAAEAKLAKAKEAIRANVRQAKTIKSMLADELEAALAPDEIDLLLKANRETLSEIEDR